LEILADPNDTLNPVAEFVLHNDNSRTEENVAFPTNDVAVSPLQAGPINLLNPVPEFTLVLHNDYLTTEENVEFPTNDAAVSPPLEPLNGKKSFLCQFKNCGKVFSHRQGLRTHEKKHSGKRFHCECGTNYSQKQALLYHRSKCHPLKTGFECKTCDRFFCSEAALQN